MNVLYVIGSMSKGGAESQLLMLMRQIKEDGYADVELFLFEKRGSLMVDAEDLGITIHDGGYSSSSPKIVRNFQLMQVFYKLLSLMLFRRPDIVHGYLPIANLFTAITGKMAFIPRIITSRRALNSHQDKRFFWKYLDKVSSFLSDTIIANSQAVKEDTLKREGIKACKVTVIPNAINVDRFSISLKVRQDIRKELCLDEADIVLIIVANLIKYKGHRELIKSLALLTDNSCRVKLLVVGDDRGIGEELKQYAVDLGVTNHIIWLGSRNDVPELLAASDIYVSASYEEGMSNSILEALAAERPVVATSVGGSPELLKWGKYGVLVDSCSPSSLADGLLSLINSRILRQQFATSSLDYVKSNYTAQALLEGHKRLYDRFY